MFLLFRWNSVCVASTCSTSDEPTPKASAPKAPCAAHGSYSPFWTISVMLLTRCMGVTADTGRPRQGKALLRTNDVNNTSSQAFVNYFHQCIRHHRSPCLRSFNPKYVSPNSLTLSSMARHCALESGSSTNSSVVVNPFRVVVLTVHQKRFEPKTS